PAQSPKQVKIPVTIEISDTSGTTQATAAVQGGVDCFDVPPALRPKPCAQAGGAIAMGYPARIASVCLRVTPKVKRGLGSTQRRPVTVRLRLTKLGQKLFAKLGGTSGGMPAQVRSSIRDRRGRTI